MSGKGMGLATTTKKTEAAWLGRQIENAARQAY